MKYYVHISNTSVYMLNAMYARMQYLKCLLLVKCFCFVACFLEMCQTAPGLVGLRVRCASPYELMGVEFLVPFFLLNFYYSALQYTSSYNLKLGLGGGEALSLCYLGN